jgi:hypothetical protein
MNKRRRYKAKARRAEKQCKCLDHLDAEIIAQAILDYLKEYPDTEEVTIIAP